MNLALKVAILETGRHQHEIARLARIGETVLSRIIQGRREAQADERRRLARVLGRLEPELFPADATDATAIRSVSGNHGR